MRNPVFNKVILFVLGFALPMSLPAGIYIIRVGARNFTRYPF